MCLLGYNPKSITILTTYNGQKYLLRDIIQQKCSWHPLFQTPKKITTVDKYQGQQNDFILLSLVRSKHIGHIRDIRRLIVAMSRAKYGLYVFGRFEVFNNCFEMKSTMNLFKQRNLSLEILLKDSNPTKRPIGDNECSIKVSDFVHMYKIVQELIKLQQAAKLQNKKQISNTEQIKAIKIDNYVVAENEEDLHENVSNENEMEEN